MKNSLEQPSPNNPDDKIEKKTTPFNNRYLLVFAVILFIGLVVHRTRQNEIKKNLVYVEVTHPLHKEMIDAISTTGSLIAEKQIMLSSKIPGKIQSVSVQQGDVIQKGQKLIQLEATELELQKSIAESAQRGAASQVDEENYKRHKILYEEGVITKAEFDKIESEYKAATAEKERLEKTVTLQGEQASSSTISAPFSAIAARVLATEGEVIQAGQPLAMLVNIDFVYVEVPISSIHIQKIQKGMPAEITTDISNEKFHGVVDLIDPVADPVSRTFNVKVKIENQNHSLKPGIFAKVKIIADKHPKALTIPKTALVKKESATGKWIYTIQKNKAYLKEIQTGLESAEDIEVISPLDPANLVVTAGQHKLYEGAPVSIVSP